MLVNVVFYAKFERQDLILENVKLSFLAIAEWVMNYEYSCVYIMDIVSELLPRRQRQLNLLLKTYALWNIFDFHKFPVTLFTMSVMFNPLLV